MGNVISDIRYACRLLMKSPGFTAVAVPVLTHGYRQRRFGSSSGVTGTTVGIDGTPHTIVGVLPTGTDGLAVANIWRPLQITPANRVGEAWPDLGA